MSAASWILAKGWRIAAHVLFIAAAGLALALSGSKYDWMEDAAPGLPGIEDPSNNRTVFVLVLLATVSLPQILIVLKSDSRRQRALSATLLLVALAIGWSRT